MQDGEDFRFIYADEILYAARLHPEEPCSHLSTRTWNRLAATIRDIIVWGIETDAMTPEEYLTGKEMNDISDRYRRGKSTSPEREKNPSRWNGSPSEDI